MAVFKILEVPLIKQDFAMSCWKAATEMVQETFKKNELLINWKCEDNNLIELKLKKLGLSNEEFLDFQSKNNLKPLSSSEPTTMRSVRTRKVEGESVPGISFNYIILLLHKYGPLWVVIENGDHVAVLVGVQNNMGAIALDSEEVLYHDPRYGTERRMGITKFNAEVKWDVKGVIAAYNNMGLTAANAGLKFKEDGLSPLKAGKLPED